LVLQLLIIFLLAVTVPAWSTEPRQLCLSCHPAHYAERGRCADCHRGNPASGRKNIAHAGLRGGAYVRFTLGDRAVTGAGEQLVEQCACRRCHVIAGCGSHLAANLDVAAARKTPGELAASIRRPVENMPGFAFDDAQITAVVSVLYAGSQGRKQDVAAPVRVHFATSGSKRTDIFSSKCGGCHRMLSARLGAIGTGAVGPNLSGLFSGFYPKTFGNGEPWTDVHLGAWLKNPRKIRPWTRMMPVMLTEPELKELTELF